MNTTDPFPEDEGVSLGDTRLFDPKALKAEVEAALRAADQAADEPSADPPPADEPPVGS
jgi:hypothetical protein